MTRARRRRPRAAGSVSDLFCSEGHVLARFVAMECDGGHEHRIYDCGAMVGRGVCGRQLVIPAFGATCSDDDDDERARP